MVFHLDMSLMCKANAHATWRLATLRPLAVLRKTATTKQALVLLLSGLGLMHPKVKQDWLVRHEPYKNYCCSVL